jgi:hypothetical protein
MQRQLLINGGLVALALGAFGVVWATRDAPTTSEISARRQQLLSELTRAKLERLEFSQGRQTLELEREGSEFRIVKPWPERADIASVNKWLTAADMASVERPADGISAEQAGFGPDAYRVTLTEAGRRQTLTLGGPAPSPTGARYAKLERGGRSLVYVVRGSVASELEVPLDSFRETRMLEYGKRELKRITLERPGSKIELEQREHSAFFVRVGAAWELARPAALRAILEQLARLSSELFVEPEQARAALDATALRLKLEPLEPRAGTVSITLGGHCPKAEQQVLLLREQPGRTPRAGCLAASVLQNLTLENEALRLRGPFAAETDEVEELYVARGAQKLDLARADKAFKLRAPSSSEVALQVGNQRIAAVLQAEGELGASDPDAAFDGELRVQVAGGDEASHREERVLLGKPRADKSVCFKRLADDVTRCVKSELARELEPDARALRSLSVFDFAPSQLVSLSVQAGPLRQRLVRRDDGSYQLQDPKGFAYDAARVADLVQRLGTLEARRWAGSNEESAFGLEQPALRVSLQLSGEATPRELVIGARSSDGRYARSSQDPGVFVLGAELFATLEEPLIDHGLCPFEEAELAQLTYHPGVQKPRNAGPQLREALLALRATRALHLGPALAAEGLSPPQLTIEYGARDGKSRRVTIGNCEPGDVPRCYARREDVDATFTLEGELARTLKDLIRR